jgi:predicted transcriptional regulator
MPNITLSIDDEVVRKVRKVAIDRDTTLTQMVREYLEAIAASEEAHREQILRDLDESFGELERDMGPRRWTRDDLYEC